MEATHATGTAAHSGIDVRRRTLALSGARSIRLVLMLVATALLIGSIFLPYWSITLHAPQYPRGLYIEAFVNRMAPERNVFEVDGLNHYIGMIKLTEAAKFERSISIVAIIAIALLSLVPCLLKKRWSWLLRLPVILYPAIFALDLFLWLLYAGHSLDKHAPMSSSISEFTPHIFGKGTIGQFHTEAEFKLGFLLALIAALITLVVTVWDRRERHGRPA